MRADAREIALLEGRCPLCDGLLNPAPALASVLGFRLFDMNALSEQEPDGRLNGPEDAHGSLATRAGGSAPGWLDGERWRDDGAAAVAVALATRPAVD